MSVHACGPGTERDAGRVRLTVTLPTTELPCDSVSWQVAPALDDGAEKPGAKCVTGMSALGCWYLGIARPSRDCDALFMLDIP